jgi:hypothetical protein
MSLPNCALVNESGENRRWEKTQIAGSHGPATEHMVRSVRTDLARASGLEKQEKFQPKAFSLYSQN